MRFNKLIIIMMIFLSVLSGAYAAEDASSSPISLGQPGVDAMYDGLLTSYMPTNVRALGMGGAQLAVGGRSDSFFVNPANLGAKKFQLSLPSVAVTVYHPYEMLKVNEDTGTSLVDDIINAMDSGNMDQVVGSATNFFRSFQKGSGKLATLDASVGFTAGGFGLGVQVRDTIHTYGGSTGGLDTQLFDELNAAATLGLGFRINLGSSFSIDIGGAVRFSYLGYTAGVGAKTALDMFGSDSSVDPAQYFTEQLPLAAGFAIPFDVGVNLNLPAGFKISTVARNLNGTYRMKVFDNVNSFTSGWSDSITGAKDFKIEVPWQLDAGLSWKWENGFFSPTVAVDMVDIVGFAKSGSFDGRNIMKHVKAGAEIRLLSVLDVRGGLNQGYWSVGAGLDLFLLKVDLAYYWLEFGETVGDYGLDGFSIRFNIGYDR